MDKLRLIKGVVILMTSLIVIGISAVIIKLTTQNDNPAPSFTTNKSPVSVISGADTILISEPKGSKITGVTGCGDNICLLISDGGEDPRLAILSAKGGLIRKVKLSDR